MYENYLMHFGILGQKWGVRRYQNFDGTLTAAGRERYGKNIKDYPEMKLRRQVGIVNNIVYGKKGKFGKVMNQYRDYSANVHNPSYDRKKTEEFLNKLTEAKLFDIGYEPSPEAVAYLRSRPWFYLPYDFVVDPTKKKTTTFIDFYGE